MKMAPVITARRCQSIYSDASSIQAPMQTEMARSFAWIHPMKATLGFFGFFGLLLAGLPATAQNSSKWKETGASINGASVFVKIDTIKNFRSVEFRNTVYKRADFSYSDLAGSTQRERFVFDCSDSSYKNNDTSPGFYSDVSWITPFTPKDSIQSVAHQFLCPGAKDPWVEFFESTETLAKLYFINAQSLSTAKNPKYGYVKSGVVLAGYKDTRIAMKTFMLYAACKQRLLGELDFFEYIQASNPALILEEQNPGSLGASWLDVLCNV